MSLTKEEQTLVAECLAGKRTDPYGLAALVRRLAGRVEALTEALGFVETTLSGHRHNWEHDGDEETGQHDEDCRACEYEALIERSRAALSSQKDAQPSGGEE